MRLPYSVLFHAFIGIIPVGDVAFGNKTWEGPLFEVKYEFHLCLRSTTLRFCTTEAETLHVSAIECSKEDISLVITFS